MAIDLTDVARTKNTSPPRILIHGPEKVGKSTLFAGGMVRTANGMEFDLSSAPNPIFVRTEDGLGGLDVDAFPLAESYQDVLDALAVLSTEEHDYKTVVIDSADWLERIIHEKVCDDDSVKSIELAGGGYGKGYTVATSHWREILQALDYLNKRRGMIVGIICHSNVVTFNDPESEPYDRYEMKLHQPKKGTGAKDMLSEWADIIGFANRKIHVAEKQTTSGQKVARGVAPHGLNKLNLIAAPGYVAGNRFNLPQTIDLSWDALYGEIIKHHGGEK